jgi:hypothetical protein
MVLDLIPNFAPPGSSRKTRDDFRTPAAVAA